MHVLHEQVKKGEEPVIKRQTEDEGVPSAATFFWCPSVQVSKCHSATVLGTEGVHLVWRRDALTGRRGDQLRGSVASHHSMSAQTS